MKETISKWKLALFCALIILFSVFNGAGIGYFTFYVDVLVGAILFGVFLGVIPAILIWKYVDRNARIV